ncbi:hypothetical protein L6452_17343 [Arctium lappa]|uniref:Uncharacterized protein n=1 Tax=Arctium lappa TaxID=4217 RepID=A0ACB9C307_ARCLA|nr:hypothetical protein L6452_17343 [Arctium lappa]
MQDSSRNLMPRRNENNKSESGGGSSMNGCNTMKKGSRISGDVDSDDQGKQLSGSDSRKVVVGVGWSEESLRTVMYLSCWGLN